MTYWHRFLDLNAAADVGRVQLGLDYIRKYWWQALQAVMTTLLEAFDPAWMGDDPHAVSMVGAEYARYGGYETSLCHGWSAGPAAWLHTAVLGVQPDTFGYAKVNFTPCLGDLAWAKGTIPTPHGPVLVSLWMERNGTQAAEITTPGEIEFNLPEHIQKAWKVILNP